MHEKNRKSKIFAFHNLKVNDSLTKNNIITCKVMCVCIYVYNILNRIRLSLNKVQQQNFSGKLDSL
jgi:hypothetical protein